MQGRTCCAIVIAILAAALLWGAGSVPLLDPDEARFARTSIEMLRSADPVVPTFEGKPRITKPPLLHWIQAALFRVLGPRELAARLPAVASTLGLLLITVGVLRRRFGDEGAAWAAAAFAAFPLVVALGKVGTIDALLSLHVGAVLALDLSGTPERRPAIPIAVGAVLGLAFLAKGPVGVVVPLLAMLAGRTAVGGGEVVPRARAWLLGAAAWCAAVLPWGLAFLWRVGPDRAVGLIRSEALERYFSSEGTLHGKPFGYYLAVCAVGFFPWCATLFLGMVRALRRRRDPAARTAAYAAAGLLAGLVFFSVGRGKLPSYILPLAPLAAIVIAWEIGQETAPGRRRGVGPILAAATLGTGAAVLTASAATGVRAEFRGAIATGAALLGAGALAAIAGLAIGRPRVTHAAVAAAGLAFATVCSAIAFPVVGRDRSAERLVRDVPALSSGQPVVTFEKHLPSLTFYLDTVPEWEGVAEVAERMTRADRPLLVVDQVDLKLLPKDTRDTLEEIGRSGRYLVFGSKARKPG